MRLSALLGAGAAQGGLQPLQVLGLVGFHNMFSFHCLYGFLLFATFNACFLFLVAPLDFPSKYNDLSKKKIHLKKTL